MARPYLGELELAVMEYFWRIGLADAKTVHGVVGEARGISLNTIQSTVERLTKKRLLTREKISHAYLYRPALTREIWMTQVIDDVMGASVRGHMDGILAAFVDFAARLDKSHLERLERLIAERKFKD
jgi:predicted transcriptional regulator